MEPYHILIAPNAFKNSLDAEAVALAIGEGLKRSDLSCTCETFPIGDGGDGTGDLIIKKCGGVLVSGDVDDPLGRTITASFGLIDEGGSKTAVIEMANAAGLRLLTPSELNPLRTNSFGTGEQIRLALDKGATRIIIGMGGSATVDGGTGMLRALGIRFLDEKGTELVSLPEDLQRLATIDVAGLDDRIGGCEIIVLCDVNNLLLGEEGAAAVFGPQKGATPEAVAKLEAALRQLAEVTRRQLGKDLTTLKHGGTAGGAAAGLYGFLDAKLVNGIDYFLELTGFDKALERADLVITGEGSIDEQTLQGKGPYGVAYMAKQKGLPVLAVAGKVPLADSEGLQEYFDVLQPIGNEPADLSVALRHTMENLVRTSRGIGNLLALSRRQSR
ncbi:MAG TPA: glycerate kinase [Puia sp.]|jgi:glycerate kinase|nr:glycerate kinase [Puia sp.]